MWRFRLFGYPVVVEWTFWVMAVLLGYGYARTPGREGALLTIMWVAVVFFSILWHEIGHALARRRFREPYSEIRLYSFGGLCSGPGHFTRWESFFVSAAGPAASLLLGGVVWLIAMTPGAETFWMRAFISMMLFTNVAWAILNLLPIYPLDGGQMFAAIVANRNPKLVYQVGMILGGVVAVLALLTGNFFAAILFGSLAFSNYQRSKGLNPSFM